MKLFLLIAISISVVSCCWTHSRNNKASAVESSAETGSRLEEQLDSFKIEFMSNIMASLEYSGGEMQVIEEFPKHRWRTSDKNDIGRIIRFLDDFIVTKAKPVEYGRVKTSTQIVTDWPCMTFGIYLKTGQVITETIQVGEENYIHVYNPEFLEFYNYLEYYLNVLMKRQSGNSEWFVPDLLWQEEETMLGTSDNSSVDYLADFDYFIGGSSIFLRIHPKSHYYEMIDGINESIGFVQFYGDTLHLTAKYRYALHSNEGTTDNNGSMNDGFIVQVVMDSISEIRYYSERFSKDDFIPLDLL